MGWGLFVATPFLVGLITGFLVNRSHVRSAAETYGAVAAAGALGTIALLMLALEGLMCVILVLPLAVGLATIGGFIGRAAAKRLVDPRQPFYSVALLPLIFCSTQRCRLSCRSETRTSTVIAASPDTVWAQSDRRPPSHRSTGTGRPGGTSLSCCKPALSAKAKARTVLASFRPAPPMSVSPSGNPAERGRFALSANRPRWRRMSPYRQLHTPHLIGYFDTGETRFDLVPLANGRTRVIATADHVLRIDPVYYWGPIARWAINAMLREC